MNVKYRISKNKYHVFYDGVRSFIRFPKEIDLSSGPSNDSILKNNVFSVSWPLAFKERVQYDFGEVFFSDFILKTCSTDVSEIAEDCRVDTRELLRDFEEARKNIFFSEVRESSCVFDNVFSDANKAMILMSFGKDSLLSFGIAGEIGMDVSLFYNFESSNDKDYESRKKVSILKRFSKSFNNRSYLLRDTTERLTVNALPSRFRDFVSSTTLFHFALLTLPIASKENIGSIIIGNEQNFNDTFVNRDGFRAYVTPDQNSEFMNGLMSLLLDFTGRNVRLMSLVEPVYNVLEFRVLYSRYPHLLKYLMSCADDRLKKGMWCCQCPMCAKAFLYTKAFGFDPRRIHLNKSFFGKEHWSLYPLFNSAPERSYEKPQKVRDEQLLSFYLAYKNGAKGYLIDEFKRRFLDEAKERYDELHKTFFGIHPSSTIPDKIRNDVLSIYMEEISKL